MLHLKRDAVGSGTLKRRRIEPSLVFSRSGRVTLERQLKRSKLEVELDLPDVSLAELSKHHIRRLVLSGPKTKRRFRVARRLPNVRQPPPPSYFGFVYNIEHPALPEHDDSPEMIHIDMETIKRDWFLDLWKNDLVPRGGDELVRLFQRSKTGIFSDDFHHFGYPERKLIYDLHSYFSQRLLNEADPAPVAILEVEVAADDWFLRYLEGAHWYQFNLRPTPTGATWADFDASGASLPDHHALISELAMDAAFDPHLSLIHI
ncbi:MAG: hypothetical protein KUG77_18475, partial [Nannocystaceae bacterium]|nr:hypothetical protein [Nannocystaceae bacterium]